MTETAQRRAGRGPIDERTPTEPRDKPPNTGSPGRLLSLDALRGFAIVILLLASNPFMRGDLWIQFKHPPWHGLRFADLFFPLFLFVVGVAMTLSRRGDSPRHAFRRAGLLALIGVGLSSLKNRRFVMPGVLQHIAGSYIVAWLVLRAPRKMHLLLTGAIFGGLWIGYVLYAGPGGDPWSRDGSLGHALDGFLIGRFSSEGVTAAIASSVTVLGGALIGKGIRGRPDPADLGRWVGVHAGWLIAAGLALSLVVPLNKQLWNPSFTLLTLGTSCMWFTLFIWLIDVRRQRWWVGPLQELGANPIAVYVTFIAVRALIGDLPVPYLAPFGSPGAGALLYSLGWLLAGWLGARWLFRRRIFIKI